MESHRRGPFQTRRAFLNRTALGVSSVAIASRAPLWGRSETRGFRIGACDWSIGKAGDPSALEVARDLGLDGVQISLGSEADDMHLRRPDWQQRYRDESRRTGVRMASLAIGELNNVPFKSDARTVAWVRDSIEVLRALEMRVVLLAFFHKGDLRNDPKGVDETVRRLRELAPGAEKAGVVLGIESWLSAEEHMAILDRVGSNAIQVYYDVANAEAVGHDPYREIRWLGRKGVICELHMKENGALLGQGRVDFRKVRVALDEIGYRGWVHIEGAVPAGAEMKPSYRRNLSFLRGILGAEALETKGEKPIAD